MSPSLHPSVPQPANPVRPWWALVVAVLALVAAGYLIAQEAPVAAEGEPHELAAMPAVSPEGELAFEDIPDQQVAQYLGASEDEEAFRAVRCYCGCERMLDHPDLFTCFVRDDGDWERHATGCGICLAQADLVMELREEGLSLDDIVEANDERYGGIIPTA